MARTLRRKTRTGGDGGKVQKPLTANGNENIPQIQELQNLMDMQRNKVEVIKASYSLQNAQLAKANSTLMIKLSDIEKKISELVQENVMLRSKVSLGEFNYKRRLSEQLDVLEAGISHRVEEIFLMFDSVRTKERLPQTASSSRSCELRSILRKRRSLGSSQGGNKSTSSIQFVDTANHAAENNGDHESTDQAENGTGYDENSAKRKRRKSSRRESIFLPKDFEFPNDESAEPAKETAVETANDQNDEDENEVAPETETRSEDAAKRTVSPHVDELAVPTDYNEQITQTEGSFSFTNSIIEYSIPEEFAPSASANTEQLSSSKIEVFRDEPEFTTSSQNQIENKQDIQTFVPSTSQGKAKHSRSAPSARSRNKLVDEVMPTTNNGTAACDIDFVRPRRTRGKAIDYKLPSLRAKMRRPTEKLVDATTFTNIHELQVPNAKRNYKKNPSRKCTTAAALKEAVIPGDQWRDDNDPRPPENNVDQTAESGHQIDNSSTTSKIGEDAISKEKLAIKPKPILKDITNRPKTSKTRKLLKSAIINDICDNNGAAYDDTTDSLGSAGSSFRLNEEDLSVFDLIGSNKAKPSNKTYRAKSKKLTTK